MLVANAELRFPLLRRADLGLIPLPLPPVEGVLFYDAAAAWFPGQRLHLSRRTVSDPMSERSLLTSHGLGIRVNLFNFAVLRWDYVWPHDAPGRRRYWQFSLGPSF